METMAASNAENARGRHREKMMSAFQFIAAFFGRLFARKSDDFKALLIADLGIER